MGCTIDANDRELLSKVWNIHRKPGNDPFRELQDKIDDLRSVQINLLEEYFDATAFADVDAEVIAVQPPPSDAEIVAELLETEASLIIINIIIIIPVKFLVLADEPVKCADKNELLLDMETLQRFSLFLDKGDAIQSYASRIESQADQHLAKKKKQASIRDFLNKK